MAKPKRVFNNKTKRYEEETISKLSKCGLVDPAYLAFIDADPNAVPVRSGCDDDIKECSDACIEQIADIFIGTNPDTDKLHSNTMLNLAMITADDINNGQFCKDNEPVDIVKTLLTYNGQQYRVNVAKTLHVTTKVNEIVSDYQRYTKEMWFDILMLHVKGNVVDNEHLEPYLNLLDPIDGDPENGFEINPSKVLDKAHGTYNRSAVLFMKKMEEDLWSTCGEDEADEENSFNHGDTLEEVKLNWFRKVIKPDEKCDEEMNNHAD